MHDNSESRLMVSVVVPALNESSGVPALLGRYREMVAAHPELDFELVLVDDGSTDGTADLAWTLAGPQDRLTVIELSRNFGAHYAISAGLARCHGDCAVLLGADLQEPASLLDRFLEQWHAGSDVVWGIRATRAGDASLLRRAASRGFSALFSRYAGLAGYPAEGPSGVLITRQVIDEVNRLSERHRNLLALIAWVGFRQAEVRYEQDPRSHGTSRWTAGRQITLAVDSMVQFTSLPLRLFTALGLAVASTGLIYAVVLVWRAATGVVTPSGWPTLMVTVLILGGTQLGVTGVMGEYLWRAVEESRRRPLYVVRQVRSGAAERQR